MRKLKGTITSTKMTGSAVVRVDRLKKHPKYKKYIRISQKFKANMPKDSDFKEGDFVLITETRPISKDKRWQLSEVLRRPVGVEEVPEEQKKNIKI